MRKHKSDAAFEEKRKVFAKEIASGKTMRASMLSAGYSPNVARKGVAGISQKMMSAITAEGYRLADIAQSFTLEEKGNIAIGRLLQNCMTGKDGGCLSAAKLGSLKDLQLFQPDSQVGIVVLNTPQKISEKIDKLLEAEE